MVKIQMEHAPWRRRSVYTLGVECNANCEVQGTPLNKCVHGQACTRHSK